jgi:MFS family permease
MADTGRTQVTFRYECLRAFAAGIVETASSTFLLLIAVRHFEAGTLAKSCVVSGAGLGFVLSPVVVARVEQLRAPVARAAARLALVGAVMLALAAVIPGLTMFALASFVAIAAASAMVPLLTQLYQDNYPEHGRGRLFSRTVMLRIVTAAGFSFVAGKLLEARMDRFGWLLLVFAAAFALSAWCLARIPSQPLHHSGGTHPFRALRLAREDLVFRHTLVSWMLMGIANLMMLPLRIDYLTSPKYGIEMATATVAVLTGVIPNVARLLMSPVWGWLFDRTNFFALRMILNCGFAIGILSFFTSDTMPGLVFAAVTYGISIAGGDVAWSLWVTKLAPAERVADYMSVHTFFTGVRGLLAPALGFTLVAHWQMKSVGFLSAGLIVLATLILLPGARRGGLRRVVEPATPPVPADEGEA